MRTKHEALLDWILDLRSDKFEQGQGWLEYDNKFCCLGVLAFRAANLGETTRTVRMGAKAVTYDKEKQFVGMIYPDTFCECILTPEFCINLNDKDKKSFKEIATILQHKHNITDEELAARKSIWETLPLIERKQ